MSLTRRNRLAARALGAATTLAVLGIIVLAAALAHRHAVRADWSANNRNLLNPVSVEVLAAMPGPIRATVYARAEGMAGRVVGELLQRYRHERDDFEVRFVNPDLEPERMRSLGIGAEGVVALEYGGQRRQVERPAEATLTNALLALARSGERWVAYLHGHGERDLTGIANHDLGTFGKHLLERGFRLQALNLLAAGEVPRNTAVLVVAGPRVDLLAEETALLEAYLARGGNLLWLLDPGALRGLEPLAERLGVTRADGTIIDPATQGFIRAGLGNPTFALISRYGRHPALDGFNMLTVFPGSGPLTVSAPDGWSAQVLLRTGERVWAERGPLTGSVSQDTASESSGPFDIGHALSRPRPGGDGEQRAAVIADGDFLSNAALGNGGNLDLGVRLVTWLAADDQLVDIPVRADADLTLMLSRTQTAVIGLGWFFGLPLVFTVVGGTLWWRRRHR